MFVKKGLTLQQPLLVCYHSLDAPELGAISNSTESQRMCIGLSAPSNHCDQDSAIGESMTFLLRCFIGRHYAVCGSYCSNDSDL